MYSNDGRNAPRLGAWYNSFSDLWGDIVGIAQHAPQVVNQANNAVTNIPRITQPSIPVNTLIYAGLGVAAFLLIEDIAGKRRRNPPRRARARRRRR